jgi:predicted nucleotidyltransferase
VYVEPRTTKDIDVVVSVPDEEQGENLKDLLLTKGYTSPQILLHTSPTRRMGWRIFIPSSRDTNIPLDILVTACGIEKEIVASATTIEALPGLSLPVASLGHLIAMKVLSQNSLERLQDRVDLLALLRNATIHDRAVVERSLKDIADRGFSGDRNLGAELHAIESGKES